MRVDQGVRMGRPCDASAIALSSVSDAGAAPLPSPAGDDASGALSSTPFATSATWGVSLEDAAVTGTSKVALGVVGTGTSVAALGAEFASSSCGESSAGGVGKSLTNVMLGTAT